MFEPAIFRRLVLSAILSMGMTAAIAQPAERQPAPTQGFDPDSVEVHEQQLLKSLGTVTGKITLPDSRAATLIQPEGRVWRDYRRGVLPWIVAAIVLGMLGILALFYAVRGKIRIKGGRGLATLLRFGAFERFMHWMTAASWCILAISGLNVAVGRWVLLPLVGNETFTVLSTWLKFSHNFLAFPFTAGIILMFLVWLRHNIPNKVDLEWLKQGGGFVGDRHPSAGKFNAGQKGVFWIVMLGGGALVLTGFTLMFPFYFTNIAGMQIDQVAHGGIALLMIAAMLGHIYIGSVGMEGALDAMNTGRVDLNWAKEHHDLWVAEELAKTAKSRPLPAE